MWQDNCYNVSAIIFKRGHKFIIPLGLPHAGENVLKRFFLANLKLFKKTKTISPEAYQTLNFLYEGLQKVAA